jgi:hypothetical protein
MTPSIKKPRMASSSKAQPFLAWEELEYIFPIVNSQMFPFLETGGHGPIFMCCHLNHLQSMISDLFIVGNTDVKIWGVYRDMKSGHTVPIGVQLRVDPLTRKSETYIFCTESLGSKNSNIMECIMILCRNDDTYAYCTVYDSTDSQTIIPYRRQHSPTGCSLFALLDLYRMITENFLYFAQRNSQRCSSGSGTRIYSLQKLPDSFMILSHSITGTPNCRGLDDYIKSEVMSHLVDIFGGIPSARLQQLDDNFIYT